MVTIKNKNRSLSILMNGILIGTLEKTKNAVLSFSYDQKWLNLPGARPLSLSMPLINKPFQGDIVYNFFDNLLPDNFQIRSRIQALFQIPTDQPFDLLASIGKDCVGAIQIIDGKIPIFKKEIFFEPLNETQIASMLRAHQNHPLGMSGNNDEFRISIAGAQEKFAFLFYKNKWNKPLGTTPTSHIFKLPMGVIQHQHLDLSDSCENEWLCMKIAEAFGLATANCEILHFEEMKALVVERFDRQFSSDGTWLMRIPQEDLCQALGISPNLKYQSDGGPNIKDIMEFLLGSNDPINERNTFFRTQILFWLLAAIDGHAKNYSIFIAPEGRYRLTPLYDIISAHPLIVKRELNAKEVKMAMALKGKNNHYHWNDLQRRYFLQTAEFSNYSSEIAEHILNEMLEAVDSVIEKVSTSLPINFPSTIAQAIFNGMRLAKRKLSA